MSSQIYEICNEQSNIEYNDLKERFQALIIDDDCNNVNTSKVIKENYVEWNVNDFEGFINKIYIEKESMIIPSCNYNWKFNIFSDENYIIFSVINDGPTKKTKINGINDKFLTKFVFSLQSRTNQFPEFMGKRISRYDGEEYLNDMLYRLNQSNFEYETIPPSYLFQISYLNEDMIYIKKNDIKNFIRPLRDKNNFTIGIYIRLYKNAKDKDPIPSPLPPQNPVLVVATKDYLASEPDQLSVKKDDLLVITDKNPKREWVFGYKYDNNSEKGLFPKKYIPLFNDEGLDLNDTEEREFTKKYKEYFKNKVKDLKLKQEMRLRDSFLDIYVNRDNIFIDALNFIMPCKNEDLKRILNIRFLGEMGIDSGGLTKEFFYLLSREIGNPDYSFFKYITGNSYRMNINPESGIPHKNHLYYFEFIGIILGMSIFHSQYIAVPFILPFYKRLLNKNLVLSDLKYIDPDIYKNLKWLKENDGAENLCLNFVIENEGSFGNKKRIELKPGGSEISVTDENKEEYIDLYVKNKLSIIEDKDQMDAIKKGFYRIIPFELIKRFNEFDLELLIHGSDKIDVDDWKNNTDYSGYKENDITIVHFWKCVREFDNESRKRLIRFATGSSQIPSTGFKDLKGDGRNMHFKLKKVGDINNLPVSHTCFNRIDLPPYPEYELLKDKLLKAITEGMDNFSIA